MSEHPVFSPTVDVFVVVSYLLALSAAVWLAMLFRKKRYLFVKPSIILLAWTHILFQWPAAIFASYYEVTLPDPYTFLLLVHGFVLIGLLISEGTGETEAQEAFARITNGAIGDGFRAAAVLVGYCTVVVAVYLSVVPFSTTGLYVIVTHPQMAALARTESLKELTNPALIYLYSTMVSGAAPLLAIELRHRFTSRNYVSVFICVAGLAALLVASSLPGARGTAVKLLLVVTIAVLLRKGLPFRPVPFVLIVATILAPAVILSLLRENQSISAANFVQYLGKYIFSRAFIMPLQVGAFYVHYAQTYGFIGIAGVPRLAVLLGVTPIDVPDTIGNLYAYSGIQNVRASANGGFLLSYYSYFGILSLPLSLVLLKLLDVTLKLYGRLVPSILLPTVAAISVAELAFISSDFTTVLVTHGFLIILLLAFALNGQEPPANEKRQRSLYNAEVV